MADFRSLRDRALSLIPQERWSRTHWTLVCVLFIVQSGIYLANPFVPLFVRDLDVNEVGDAALWSGVLIGSGALVGSVWNYAVSAIYTWRR